MPVTQAPAGGVVSSVNGRFYNGGEFIPDHGKSCGRGVLADVQQEAERIAAAIGWTLTRDAKGIWRAKSPSGSGESCPSLKPVLKRLRDEYFRRPGIRQGGPW